MADSTLNRFLARGTQAQRLAFTPSPPTPSSGPSQGYIWFETDTGDTYGWTGSGWQKLNVLSAGSFRGALITKSADQTAANYTVNPTYVGWDSESYDTDSLHSKAAIVTITIASPGVVSWNAHGLIDGTPIVFSSTGALPTGITAGTTYYVKSPTTNSFNIAATAGGAAINTSGTQSGTHTATTHNSIMVVPSGVTKVRLVGQISMNNVTASKYVFVALDKNGSSATYVGHAVQAAILDAGFPVVSVSSPVLTVTAGDFFQLRLLIETDTSVDVIANDSWFSMELVA